MRSNWSATSLSRKLLKPVSLLTLLSTCGIASTARPDVTAYFTAGVGSTASQGVYRITASTVGDHGSLFIPAGGTLSLTNPEGLAYLPTAGSNFPSNFSSSLLVSSYDTNQIDAYDLDGNPEGIFYAGIQTPTRLVVASRPPNVYAVAGVGNGNRAVIDRISLDGILAGNNVPDPNGTTAIWSLANGPFSTPSFGMTSHGVQSIHVYDDAPNLESYIATNLASSPNGMALGPFGDIYVALGLKVEKFSHSGVDLGTVYSSTYRIEDIGFGPDGKLYALQRDQLIRINVNSATPTVEQTNTLPAGVWANALLMGSNTEPGGVIKLADFRVDAAALLKSVDIRFPVSVTPGVTGVVSLDSATLHSMPGIPGVTLFDAVNVFSNANITGATSLTFGLDPTVIPDDYNEGNLHIYAYDANSGWQDITGFRNFDHDTIDASVNSFETFAIGAPSVPEPSSLVLASFCLTGLALCGWRRRAANRVTARRSSALIQCTAPRLAWLLTALLICIASSTARADVTAFFTAGAGSASPGVYEINASSKTAKGTLFIPAGGTLSLTDAEGLTYVSNAGTQFTSSFSASLFVSSAGNNQILAYDLLGNPEGVFSDAIQSPKRLAVSRDQGDEYVFATGALQGNPRGGIYRIDKSGSDPGLFIDNPNLSAQIWSLCNIGASEPVLGETVDPFVEIEEPGSGFITSLTRDSNVSEPRGIALGPLNTLYVAFADNVRKFSIVANHISDQGIVFTRDPKSGTQIQDVGIGPDGKLYVLQSDRLDRVNVAVGAPKLEQTNTFQSAVSANSLLMASNTEPGGIVHLADFRVNATALLKGVKFNAPAHANAGVTGVVALDADTLHSLPGITGVTLFDAINIFGSAPFTDSLQMGFEFDPTVIPDGYTEGDLRLFGFDPIDGWHDVTGFRNFDQQSIDVTANPFQTFAIGAVTAPEPNSFVLAAFSVVGLAVYGWRRRAPSQAIGLDDLTHAWHRVIARWSLAVSYGNTKYRVLLLVTLLIGNASTACADVTAFFTAGAGSANPGVYEINASSTTAKGTRLIADGGSLSLSDAEGLTYVPNTDTQFTSSFNDSLLVSSSGNNQILAYDLVGNPEGVFSTDVPSPQRVSIVQDGTGYHVEAIGAWETRPGGANYIMTGTNGHAGVIISTSGNDEFTSLGNFSLRNDKEGTFGMIAGGVSGLQPAFAGYGTFIPFGNGLPEPRAIAMGPFNFMYVAFPESVKKFSVNGSGGSINDLGPVFTLDPAAGREVKDIGFGPDGKLYVLEKDRLDRVNIAAGAPKVEQTNKFATGVLANSLLMASNTDKGGVIKLADFRVNAAALLKSLKFQFPQTVTPGVTGVVALDDALLRSLPGISGVTLFDAINVFTNAQISGDISLQFEYDATVLPDGYYEGDLHIFGYNSDTGWQDITGFRNFDHQTIDATVNSFETFAIGAPTVPEPTSFALAMFGVTGLALYNWRRRATSRTKAPSHLSHARQRPRVIARRSSRRVIGKTQSIVFRVTLLLMCGSASTARSEVTAYFTAGAGSTNPGVYKIAASDATDNGALFVPAGGALSLADPEGLAFVPTDATNFPSRFNYNLLVSSSGNNQILAYDLAGSPEGVFSNEVDAPERVSIIRNDTSYYVEAIGAMGTKPRGADNILTKPDGHAETVILTQGNDQFWSLGNFSVHNDSQGTYGMKFGGANGLMPAFSGNGTFIPFGSNFSEPRGIALGPFFDIYVAFADSVRRFSLEGSNLKDQGALLTVDPATNNQIEDIGFDPDGKLYVLEQKSLVRVNVTGGTPTVEQANTFPTGTLANSLLMAPNNFPGGVLQLADFHVDAHALLRSVRINLPQTVTPGVTGVVALDSARLHSLPGIPGVTLFDAVNVFTNSQISGALLLQFGFDPSVIPDGYYEGDLHIFGYDSDTGWQDITGFRNFDHQTIDASVNSFETFAIGAPTVPEPTSMILAVCGVLGRCVYSWRRLKRYPQLD